MTELQRKANEVQSRFSLSGYYQSQVKDPTPEMLADMKSVVDPETGEVVKMKKTRRVAVKKEGETTSKSARGKKNVKEEMTLESDSESEDLILTDESEDDVIRDNRAAIAERKKQEQEVTSEIASKSGRKTSTKTARETSTKTARETTTKATNKDVMEEEETPTTSKTPAKKPTVKRVSMESDSSPVKKPAKAAGRKVTKKVATTKTAAKSNEMEEEEAPTKNVETVISDDSDEDSYVPLAQRLKMKMHDEKRSSIVDELASTKTTVPSSKKRRVTKKPAKKSTKDDTDSSDSLFGF